MMRKHTTLICALVAAAGLVAFAQRPPSKTASGEREKIERKPTVNGSSNSP